MMNYSKLTLIVILCLISIFVFSQTDTTQTNTPKNNKISFRDPIDNAFDMSSFLLEHKGLLPVPTIITEPAVGYGGGAALVYFHHRKKQYKSYVPPNISGVLGLATENGTWATGAFHSHTFGKNRVRTMTAAGKPVVHYNYYGNNSELLSKHPIKVKLDSWLFFQRAQIRLAESNFYIGLSYSYFKTNITLDAQSDNPLIDDLIKRLNVNSVISKLKPMVVYDNRDNVFTPTKGIEAELSLNYSAEWLGSSQDYNLLRAKFYGFYPLNDRLFSGWRFEENTLFGDAPFYAYPFVQLRGIPAMRYQGDNTVLAETEWRYVAHKRFSLIGFSGLGKAFESTKTFNERDWAYTVGTGFRYEIARLLGLHMGTDFAWGNGKDFAFYIVFGSSWM